MVTIRKPMSLPLGQVVATPGAIRLLVSAGTLPVVLLRRHAAGDWGCIPPSDRELNDLAVANGSRILSSYQVGSGKLWIITEADRTATTLLLPGEY